MKGQSGRLLSTPRRQHAAATLAEYCSADYIVVSNFYFSEDGMAMLHKAGFLLIFDFYVIIAFVEGLMY